MKSSPSIWQYVVSVKSMMKISSIFVAFLENTNFKWKKFQVRLQKGSEPIVIHKNVLSFYTLLV